MPPSRQPSGRSHLANRLERLRVRHLKLLELVGASGSLSAAASALRVSQPSATKMLQDLESAFGQVLVDRTTRGGKLSTAGERVLERLRIATGALDAIQDALAVDSEAPLVRVGMLPLAGVALLPRLVATLRARGQLPRLQLLDGTVAGVLSMLRRGEIDCVLGRVASGSTGHDADAFDIEPLVDEHFEVACGRSNPIARLRRLQLPRLREQPWILPSAQSYTRQAFDQAFVSIGIAPPRVQIESPSFHVSLATVAETDMLTLAPRSAVEYYAGLGKVRKLNLAQPFQADYVVFIRLRSAAPYPCVELIRKTLRELTA
jgi:molybdate transport repressor ModE-like protein